MRLLTVLGGLLLLAAAMVLVDSAQAQDTTVTLTPVEPNGTITPGGSATLDVEVQGDCSHAFFSGGSASIDIGLEGELPEGVSVEGDTVTVDGAACLQSASASFQETAQLTFSATEDAIGFVPLEGTITATSTNMAGGEASGSAPLPPGLMVGYRPGHTLDPSGDQTFEVDGDQHAFNLTIEVQANAMTMVMFEDKQVPPGAKLDGLKAVTFDVATGERSATLPILFTAPSGDWEQVNVTFRHFSHCMGGSPCDPQMVQNVTWTFTNVGAGPTGGNGGGGEDSPGIGLAALLALVGVAALLRRRA